MKYKLSSNINISKTEDGSSIVLNSNDAQYYHFDKLTTDFLASLIKGVTLEDFCKNVSINYSVELYQVIKDYKEIILSNKVMEDSAEKSGLGITAKQLAGKVSVDAPKDTRIISITVRDKDPQVASQLANTVKEVSADQIKEVTKIDDVTTLEEAKAATSPSSPNIPKNAILATALGFIIAVAGVVLFELLDDRIKRAEDIEDGMGLVLLGVVPDTKTGKR